MSATPKKHFNSLNFSRKLKQAGLAPEIADLQAEGMDEVIEDIINNAPYATKSDMQIFKKDVDIRFERMDRKVEDLRKDMNTGFESLQKNVTIQLSYNTNKILLLFVTFSGGLLTVMAKGFHWF